MKGIIEWFARNSVAANLMIAFIIASGILATTNVKEEQFPEMALDRINVEVPYLGAAPEEVEEAVNVRIEEAIQGIEGIKRIRSTASEGMGTVTVEMELGADARRVIDEVKSNIDTITTFPLEAEKPIIRELTVRQQVALTDRQRGEGARRASSRARPSGVNGMRPSGGSTMSDVRPVDSPRSNQNAL